MEKSFALESRKVILVSNILIKVLLLEYIVIAAVCFYEKNYARLLYWVSASGLQVAILWGMR